ncbi:MAG: hypothetical protein AAGK14_14555 [Verrucomicrobiota bacterium]
MNNIKKSHRRIKIYLRNEDEAYIDQHPMKGVPKHLFSKIVSQFGKYQIYNDQIKIDLPYGHPDLDDILKLANELNLHIEPNIAKKSQIEIEDFTVYDDSEIASSKYLECSISKSNFDGIVDLDKNGNPFVISENIDALKNQEFGLMTNFPRLFFIRGTLKKRLESFKLRGVNFYLLPTNSVSGEWPNRVDPLYLIQSSIIFPEVDMEVFDTNETVIKSCDCDWGDTKKLWYPIDGYEVKPTLKYKGPLPEVDVALTKEHFGGIGRGYHRIIYSHRAVEVLKSVGLKLVLNPVAVG